MIKTIAFVCFLLLGICPAVEAADIEPGPTLGLTTDTSMVVAKDLAADIFKPYLNDSSFDYTPAPTPSGAGILDKILYEISKILKAIFNNRVTPKLLIFLIFVAFVFFMVLLFGGDFQTLFSRSKANNGHIDAFVEENLSETDFEALIGAELTKGNLNIAVRYLYLKLLQALSRRHFIEWQKDKTNRQYAHELSKQPFCPDFKSVTKTYEYVWYGKFQISIQTFGEVRNQVDQLINKVNG